MGFEEAIDKLKEECAKMNNECDCRGESCMSCYLRMAMDALGKQIPRKPMLESDGYWNGEPVYDTWVCPLCGVEYEIDYEEYNVCPSCGQKIDWSWQKEDDNED